MNPSAVTLDQLLASQETELVEAIVSEQYARQPDLALRYGDKGRIRCREDAAYHLTYLRQAVVFDSPMLFADYVAWVQVVLAQRNIPTSDLDMNLRILHNTVRHRLASAEQAILDQCMEAGLEQLRMGPVVPHSCIDTPGNLASLAQEYLATLLRLERHTASQMILEAVRAGMSVKEIYLSVFQPVQYEIGRLWQMNVISVAQEHYCTAATQLILSQLYPYILSEEQSKGVVVVTCIGTELHELGARMVADFFETEKWHSIYLSANMPTDAILRILEEAEPNILCLSITMSYHLQTARDLIASVRDNRALKQVKIIVGGYPFQLDPDLWRKIGADGYGADAHEAVQIANRLISM